MQKRFAKIQWACRRGMKELDLFLLPFAENRFYLLNQNQQNDFEQLLMLSDLALFECFFKQKQLANADLQSMINIIKSYHQYVAN